ncbi:hypothetical protein PC123_g14940 [Phytophthora cactorum]|nr:hypothetical protein PC123_g14940 [Phytophthora cactorum]
MLCHETVHLGLSIVTATGLLAPTNIECLVLDTPVQELLLGTEALQWIGVNLDGIFEQLLQQNLEDAGAEADDVPSNQV